MKLTSKTNNIFMRMFFTLSLVFTILVASNFLYANTVQPPAHNAPAPINVSDTKQVKQGDLVVKGTTTIGSNKSMLVVKGVTDMNKGLLIDGGVYVNNKVKALKYCDRDGNNCFKAANVPSLPNCANGKFLKMVKGAWSCGTITAPTSVLITEPVPAPKPIIITGNCSGNTPACPPGKIQAGARFWASSCGSEGGDRWAVTCI